MLLTIVFALFSLVCLICTVVGAIREVQPFMTIGFGLGTFVFAVLAVVAFFV